MSEPGALQPTHRSAFSSCFSSVVLSTPHSHPPPRRIMAHRDVYILIPRTCEYVILHGKKEFTGGTEFRILTMETADVTERKRFEDTTLLALKKKRKEGAMSQGMQAACSISSESPYLSLSLIRTLVIISTCLQNPR